MTSKWQNSQTACLKPESNPDKDSVRGYKERHARILMVARSSLHQKAGYIVADQPLSHWLHKQISGGPYVLDHGFVLCGTSVTSKPYGRVIQTVARIWLKDGRKHHRSTNARNCFFRDDSSLSRTQGECSGEIHGVDSDGRKFSFQNRLPHVRSKFSVDQQII